MDRLPEELLDELFTYLYDVIDLVHVGQAHHRFNATACRLLDRIKISEMKQQQRFPFNRTIIIENDNCSPLLQYLPYPKRLLISCCHGVTDDWLKKLPNSIISLEIRGLEMSLMNLQYLLNLEHLPRLIHLDIQQHLPDDRKLLSIRASRNYLESLLIDGRRSRRVIVDWVPMMTKLMKTLDFAWSFSCKIVPCDCSEVRRSKGNGGGGGGGGGGICPGYS